MRALLLCLLPCLLLGASGCAVPLAEGDRPLLEVPAEGGPPARSDDEAQAQVALQVGRYEEAGSAYYALSEREADAPRRAEFLFLAAESALGSGDHYLAYFRYARLLKLYPGTERYARAVERIFLIGRLYCEGKATKPSWLLGIEMSDYEFGVQALERFQRERERHVSADDALHYVALAYEELQNEELAIESWSKLVRFYPESEWAETAQFRASLATMRISDGVRYDKGPLLRGLQLLEGYAQQHPQGNHITECLERIAALREELAGQLLRTARYYYSANQLYSTQLYLTAILRDYPKTGAAGAAQTLAAKIPRTSPPAAPAPPKDLEAADGLNEDRLRIAPAPVDDYW